ncbi:MAG: hypothetical protein AB8B64_18795 [Granulosicoccus sp.]
MDVDCRDTPVASSASLAQDTALSGAEGGSLVFCKDALVKRTLNQFDSDSTGAID